MHYDVMVTLILAFIFLAPYWVNFNDKPTERIAHQTGVIVIPDGRGFVYQIDASAIQGSDDATIRTNLIRVIEPIAGEIVLVRYEPVSDKKGHLIGYRAWVHKPY
jgi:hypothetical protein